MRIPAAERFWPKVDKSAPGGCWLWAAAISSAGYGNFWDGVRYLSAHRFAYETLVGPVPDGLDLDHLCRNRWCVNPDHLEPVTRQVNLLRGETIAAVHARKTECKRGHPFNEANTGHDSGGRRCRECKNARRRIAA